MSEHLESVEEATVAAAAAEPEAGSWSEQPAAIASEPEADAWSEQPVAATAVSEDSDATPVGDAATADDSEAPTGDSEESALPEETEASDQTDSSGRVVRMLYVGQQVTGVVRRTTDFGAFVDIGVGRDGLIHVSELSTRRVGKVSDVLQDGQEITVWIKKLDRERNRISLTLLAPGTKTIRDLHNGDVVEGTVTRILPYGAFIDIGVGRDALLHVREMSDGFVAKPEDVVQVGEKLEARIIEVSRRRQRIDLSLKGLRPEPEPEPQPAPAFAPAARSEPAPEEEEGSHPLDEAEVLSPMELAFKRAMEAEGFPLDVSDKKQGRRRKHAKTRSIQDEIIARTLEISRGK